MTRHLIASIAIALAAIEPLPLYADQQKPLKHDRPLETAIKSAGQHYPLPQVRRPRRVSVSRRSCLEKMGIGAGVGAGVGAVGLGVAVPADRAKAVASGAYLGAALGLLVGFGTCGR